VSTLNRKAWGDLTRHRARTLLAVFTLSIAIASLGFLAVPSLLNAAMNRQVQESHLYDVGVSTSPLDLSPAQLSVLGHLPDIAAVSPGVGYVTKATSAAGTQNVEIAGTALASAPVNTVPLLTGRMPGPGEVLADAANGRAADFSVPNGGTIHVLAASGALVPLRVSGTGMNLGATPGANGSTTPVFYTSAATVESLRGVRGYTYLGFRLTDDTPAGDSTAITAVRAYLTAQTGTEARLRFSIGVGLTSSSRPFGRQALAVAASTPGITGAQPVETSSVRYDGQVYPAEGLGTHPFYAYRLSAGHWFTAADTAADAYTATPPVVLGPAVARAARAGAGQILTLGTAAGYTHVRVVGIDTVDNNNGDEVYFPLPALERLDGGPGTASSLWLTTASSGHAAIDRAAAAVAVASRLTAAGYRVGTTDVYVAEADATATATAVLTIAQILGLLVVGITLMGLVSALSTGVIERTREIGILRCVGARARHIRRIFTAEAVVLAAAGWVVAVPLGWLMYEGLLALLLHNSDISLPQEFQPVIPLITLGGVVVLTLIVIRAPLRRATRIRPGTALRYQ
jgi:hypothetical protein